jgi:hypothetical protein
MKSKYWLCRRGDVYFRFDSTTGKRESLRTSDKQEAARILNRTTVNVLKSIGSKRQPAAPSPDFWGALHSNTPKRGGMAASEPSYTYF